MDYKKLLKKVEGWIVGTTDSKCLASYLDLIIKIKTIQAMDVSAELIEVSRKVLPR